MFLVISSRETQLRKGGVKDLLVPDVDSRFLGVNFGLGLSIQVVVESNSLMNGLSVISWLRFCWSSPGILVVTIWRDNTESIWVAAENAGVSVVVIIGFLAYWK